MAATYTQITSTELSVAANSITVSSIPSTYTDLRIVLYVPTYSGTNNDLFMQFNSDTGTNYSGQNFQSSGTAINSVNYTNATALIFSWQTIYTSSTYPSLYTMDLMSYTSGNYKTALVQGSGNRDTTGTVARSVHLWKSTNSVSSCYVYVGGGQTMSAGTQLSLYGIKAA